MATKDLTINDVITPIQKITGTPLGGALLAGLTTAALTDLTYPLFSDTYAEAATMLPGDHDKQQILYDLNNPKWRKWFPLIAGSVPAATILALTYGDKSGMKNWVTPWKTASLRLNIVDGKASIASGKQASSDYFDWDINDQSYLDFGKLIPVRMAKNVVLNDPNAEVYQKGNALEVINDASKDGAAPTMSAGSLFDSALNNIQQNLTLGGITSTAVRATLSTGLAKAFTNVMCSLVGMPNIYRDAIVKGGLLTSVIKGMSVPNE